MSAPAADGGDSAALRFVVFCPKHDGTRRQWERFATREEATKVAQALQVVGCAAHVEELTADSEALTPCPSRP